MKVRSSVALFLLSVLVVLASKSPGAGAWVLWVQEERFSDPKGGHWSTVTRRWDVLDASSSEAECRQKLGERIKGVTNSNKSSKDAKVLYKVIGNTVRFLFYPNDAKRADTMIAAQDLHYVCLPDTVDPREPKGGN
jgi:hypothetical protein